MNNGLITFILGCIFEIAAIASIVSGKSAGISAKGTHPATITFTDKPIEFSIVTALAIWIGYLLIKNGIKKMKGDDSL